ncbi:MAG: CDP-diacylglycerol-inositol 3-phosphatidyltransferase [Chaenotheca gracillima]|nr:MAG: CDP-diacylglycerol-inositol 3-phosphatidyltransferase [Chaenotheca gracillima]
MQLLGQVLLASAAFSSLALANPVKRAEAKTFTVNQVAKKATKGKSGASALANAYGKYGAAIPKELAAAVDGSVTATPSEYDEEYTCPVQIGTPAQTLELDFDTGSSDLWVFSTELSTTSQRGHHVFNPAKSSTFKKLTGYTWSISYGDGSGASGDVGTDVVKVGATSVTTQAVELAKTVSAQFTSDTTNDGLLGLAMSSINTVRPTPQKTFFDNAKSGLQSPLFTADLKHQAPGSYDFGFIDSSKYTGSISYTPVNTANGFWEFTSNGYAVGTAAFKSLSIDSIADTGTTLLLLPASVVTAYYAKVSGAQNSASAGGYTFPCSATLPSFTFGVGTYRGVIPGSIINYAPLDSTGRTCFGGIQSNAGIGFSIFGDIMFKAQFVIFDGGNTRLGSYHPQPSSFVQAG